MVKLRYRLIAADVASMTIGTVVASPPAVTSGSGQGPTPESTEALARAYWSDRAGRLPPNRPVTIRPAPQWSRHQPAEAGPGNELRPLEITLPAGGGPRNRLQGSGL